MKNLYFLTMPLCVAGNLFAHSTIKIKVLERTSEQPVAGAIVQLMGENNSTTTDQNGSFEFKGLAAGNYTIKISLIGFHAKTDTISIEENESVSKTIYMDESTVNMSEITVTSAQDLGLNTLSAIDFRLRPHLTTQDLLRLVPGLFIAQHAGGGKAEQIFLRGFDVDHGTDVAISVDNMPVNMVSHAHGQGYADLHFIIPETIEKVNFAKGPYDSKVGNLNTAGSVQFQTKNYLPQNFVKTEFGSFNTYRGVAMANILNQTDTSDKRHNAFVAAEYFYSSSYFQRPQDFSRVNLFGKYAGQLNSTTNVTFSLSNFKSSWDASGQIQKEQSTMELFLDLAR